MVQLRQKTTALNSVWTALQASGTGLGVAQPTYPAMITRTQAQRSLADIVYRYTKGGRVDTMLYPPVSMRTDYRYNQRKWLDKITARRTYIPGTAPLLVFEQALTHDSGGQMVAQTWKRTPNWPVPGAVTKTQTYNYDNADRLTRWIEGTDTTNYRYDAVGNRLADTLRVTGASSLHAYNYGAGGPNRLAQMVDRAGGGGLTGMATYGYDADGAVTSRIRSNSMAQPTGSEQYAYSCVFR